MGSKRFDMIHDFVRFGVNIHITCGNGHCRHTGVADAHACDMWFRLHRWPSALEAGAARHFRCTRCRHKASGLSPTMNDVTVTRFFPVDEQGWKRLAQRLRG